MGGSQHVHLPVHASAEGYTDSVHADTTDTHGTPKHISTLNAEIKHEVSNTHYTDTHQNNNYNTIKNTNTNHLTNINN